LIHDDNARFQSGDATKTTPGGTAGKGFHSGVPSPRMRHDYGAVKIEYPHDWRLVAAIPKDC
jgi:hypothetical protein